jgi:hypothetical protein
MDNDQAPRHRATAARFTSGQVVCSVCNGTAWETGPDVLVIRGIDDTDEQSFNRMLGPFRHFMCFICRDCGHSMLVFVADIS